MPAAPHDSMAEPVRPPRGASSRQRRGYASGKDDYLGRLKKIEGQVRGIQKMVEDDRWCPDIVTQIASVSGALQEVTVGLLNDHLQHCVVHAMQSSETDGGEALREVTSTIRQILRM